MRDLFRLCEMLLVTEAREDIECQKLSEHFPILIGTLVMC
jgi:hypothetical protein